MAKKLCKDDPGAGKVKKGTAAYECKSCGLRALKEKKLCKPKKV